MKILIVLLICSSINSQNDTLEEFRKHFGLSYYNECQDYIKTFKCLTACKSIGYQLFRMNRACKCTCHELKTSTILPFFKWRTNGTTRKLPVTQSPSLYHIVGTLSPAYESEETTAGNGTASSSSEEGGVTTDSSAGNGTKTGNGTAADGAGGAKGNGTEATGGAAPTNAALAA